MVDIAPLDKSSDGSEEFDDDQIGGGLLGDAGDAPYYGGFFDDDESCDEDEESVVEECSALVSASKQIVSADHIQIDMLSDDEMEQEEDEGVDSRAKNSFDDTEPKIKVDYLDGSTPEIHERNSLHDGYSESDLSAKLAQHEMMGPVDDDKSSSRKRHDQIGRGLVDSDKCSDAKNLSTRLDFTAFQSSPVCETPDNFDDTNEKGSSYK